MKKLFFIIIGVTLIYADIMRDDTNGIVLDTTTNLEWQDDAVGVRLGWQDAIDTCEELVLGGYDDWRLPNIQELKSIVDRSKANPAIKDGFLYTESQIYWTSTTYMKEVPPSGDLYKYAWNVYFTSGYIGHDTKRYRSYFVRCVRGGLSEESIPG